MNYDSIFSLDALGSLSRHYESNGDPGCISSGDYDDGGKSYGAYQFSSAYGIVEDFLHWAKVMYPTSYCVKELLIHVPHSPAFDKKWRELGHTNGDEFLQLQHLYIGHTYFLPAVKALKKEYFHIEHHSFAMAEVLWSRAVQYGPYQMVDLFTDAVHRLGYPNLSYVDAMQFDWDMIVAIYETCSTYEWNAGPLRSVLNDRFESECYDALQLLNTKMVH